MGYTIRNVRCDATQSSDDTNGAVNRSLNRRNRIRIAIQIESCEEFGFGLELRRECMREERKEKKNEKEKGSGVVGGKR